MALLAEEIVEEWLNRQGYFTIRGIKIGVHEIDLLAIKIDGDAIECRHFEVQASVHPVSYITSVPKAIRKATGRAAMSSKERSIEELQISVQEWVHKKYLLPAKQQLRNRLHPGHWSFELVLHEIKHQEELEMIQAAGIRVHRLYEIVDELRTSKTIIESACGASLLELILLHVNRSPPIHKEPK